MRLAESARPHRTPIGGVFLLGSLALFWGLSWPTIKIVLAEMPVLGFRAICCAAGGAGALLLARLGGERIRLPRAEILPLALLGILNVTLWQIFMAYGLRLLTAGHASIIAYTMPAFATLFGWIFLSERITWARYVGLALSMAGLAVLVAPEFEQFAAAPAGVLFMVGAAATWAGGTVGQKYFRWSISVMQNTGWQFAFGGIPIVIAAVVSDSDPHLGALSTKAWICFIYVLICPILFCQWAWLKVVDMLPGSVSAMGTLAVPVVGMLSGAALLGETLGPAEVVALGLVVLGLALVVLGPRGGRRE
ncbi:MAG TPA: DMT family transporter [Stellaceae bacterium]|nr:DMT family transporter [Stellaceae bacterium]